MDRTTDSAFRIARCVFAFALLAFGVSSADVVVWSPRVQVSHAAADENTIETMVRGFAFQRDGAPGLHAMLAIDKTGLYTQEYAYNGNGYYLAVPGDLDWAEAWSARERFTLDDTPDTSLMWVSADHSMTIDADNAVHALFEDFLSGAGNPPDASGYKVNSASRWSADEPSWILPSTGASACANGSPTFYLWEDGVAGTAGDTLHAVIEQRGGQSCENNGWHVHWKRSLAESDSTWIQGGFVWDDKPAGGAPFGSGPVVLVDAFDQLHLLFTSDDTERRHILHVWGAQPDSGATMSATVDTLDAYDLPTPPSGDDDLSAAVTSFSLLRGEGACIDVAWNHKSGPDSQSVYFSRIPLDDTENFADNSTPIRISPDVGIRYGRARVSHGDDGAVYVTYLRGGYQGAGAAQVYSVSQGNPSSSANWTRGIPVTPSVRTWASDGFLLARGDSLFTLYASHDDDDADDEDIEAWFQVGEEFPDSVAAGQKVVWPAGSQVALAADFVIAEAGTLLVEEDVTVWVAANIDNNNAGSDSTRAEVIVRGTLLVEGTEGNEVTFRSTAGNPGDWGSIVFDLEGCESAAYGYAGCLQPVSSLEHAKIEDASYGIVLEGLCAPNLANLEFEDITDDRHIFLKSDAVIPQGYWAGTCDTGSFTWVPTAWDLGGGTRVVASTTEFNDAWVGVEDKNDLIVYGKLFTDGSSAAGDQVFFAPDDTTNVGTSGAGQDWGGILLTNFADGSKLRWANIGYAANPVFLASPDSLTEIENSTIHHFADVGIWVHGSMGSGGAIENCLVDRGGTAFHPSLGETGIYLDQADEFAVVGTTVSMEGRNDDASGTTGIAVRYGKTFCQTPPSSHRDLVLQDNYVLGPGRDVENGNADTGLQTNWVCGSLDRDIDILENVFWGWKFTGLEFVQTADVQVSCNFSIGNNRGVDIYRDSEPTGSAIRFKDNRLEATVPDTLFFALRTNDAVKTKLGPTQADRGKNRLKVNQVKTKFIFETDATSADTLYAQDNFWYADTLFHQAADTTQIKSRLAPTGYSIDYGSYETDDTSLPSCWPDTSGLGLPSAMIPGGHRLSPRAEQRALDVALSDEPSVLELGMPAPNPSRSGAILSLAVPRNATGVYEAGVFDVRGRRVWASRQEVVQAGRYWVAWDGLDEDKRRVAAGVYFLRLSGPGGFSAMRKVTVMR